MKIVSAIFVIAFVAMVNGSLLEMSQTLWTKVLEGGLTKIGALDPLRVPVIKVDQSEGNTSYRIILRSLEIIGLNSSSLESIHIARGRLKTNLSENEAGYVSYTDQRELDTIRYRFHTVVKEPKSEESENLKVKPIPELENTRTDENQYGRIKNYDSSSRNDQNQERAFSDEQRTTNYQSSSRYQDNQQRTAPQRQRPSYESSSRFDDEQRGSQGSQGYRSNYETSQIREVRPRYYVQSQNSPRPLDKSKTSEEYQGEQQESYTAPRFSSDQQNLRYPAGMKDGPGRVRVIYAERRTYPEDNSKTSNQRPVADRNGDSGCDGSCEFRRKQGYSENRDNQQEAAKNRQEEDIGVAASMNFESRRAYVDAKVEPARNNEEESTKGRVRFNVPTNENRYAATFDGKIGDRNNNNNNQGKYEQSVESSSSRTRLEDQPGYVDILYADEKDQKMRHFGNLRVEQGRGRIVYSLEDVLKDLRDHRRFIIHNFTEGEALTKKNDAVRTANESKRIKDLIRYAKDFQEKQGYYEEGMQLIYHYGGKDGNEEDSKDESKRRKRAHLNEETDDDVMHVIMKIRVPMLRVNAGYVLMGKVGKQVLRGNGLLAGNFTELIGDFTLEMKKVAEDTMIVRAARARLSAKDQKITLQGMDEEGPVKEILTQGLMAAEAVAAMLADDLATKALSEKTADSIIYKMYKNLPVEN